MNAEVVGIGTELLLGQIANTNAQFISSRLADIGVNVFFHSVVGDNLDRARSVVEHAMARSDCVIVTGGLGPTPDDLTREVIAAAAGAPLQRDERLVEMVRGVFASSGRDMPEENAKQADLPEGATAIEPQGTAPGFYLDADGVFVCALPGVPWEMKAMMEGAVLPVLRERAGDVTIVSRQVLVIGLGESHTHQKIKDLVDAQSNPTIAYLSGRGQVRVRITARAENQAQADALIAPVEDEIRARLGEAAVPGNDGSLAQTLGRMLVARGLTVGAAESLTGGLLGATLTETDGASDFFAGSLVCYTHEAKHRVAGVPSEVLDGPGAVSEEAAAHLARGAARQLGADLGLSTTGVAGPAAHDGKPVGTVFVGAHLDHRTEVRSVRGYGDRQNVRDLAVTSALDLARRLIQAS